MIQTLFAQRAQRALKEPRAPALPVLITLVVLCCISCSSAGITESFTEKVLVTLPEPHPVYTLLSKTALPSPGIKPSYTAHWYDSDGKKQTLTNVSDDFCITLETGVCTPILLVPDTARFGIPDGALPMAGGIYPEHGRVSALRTGMGAVLETSWLQGISASLAEEICLSSAGGFASGRNIADHFNWRRFDTGLSAITDPTHIDRPRFVRAVLSGHFAQYDISYQKIIPVDPATMRFIPSSSVFFPAWASSSGYSQNGAETVPLAACEGNNRYFCQSGYLTVQITLGKMTCAFFTSYILPD